MNLELENSFVPQLDQLSCLLLSYMNGTNVPSLLPTIWNMKSLSIRLSFHQFAQHHQMFSTGKLVIVWIFQLSCARCCVVLDMMPTLLLEPLLNPSL